MNWQHFRAVFWLRWRLQVNQTSRRGVGGFVLLILAAILAVTLGFGTFVASLALGLTELADASPAALMLVWDALIVAFLVIWIIGLVTELQRAEVFSLDKFLHLPISLGGLFLINYAATFLKFSLVAVVPAMVGLSIALVLTKGPVMLVLFPVVAALLAVVTAVTYQFQGWLASLMANKRRRRTIITFVTAGFILVAQIPSLLNLMGFLESSSRRMKKEIAEIERALEAGQINSDEYQRQTEAVRAKYEEESEGPSRESVERIAGLVNVVVPVAWPAHAARRAAEDALLPALAVTVGLALIAAASLRRSYRTTVSLYTGEFSSGKRRAPTVSETRAASPATSQPARSSLTLLETRLPWLSEQVSAIAVASFRSLTRAPEAKMVLLGPVIMLVVLGAMFMRGNMASSEFFRPLAATGAITLILLGVNQLGANQFGFDRSGFRAFVLGPVSRKDILLGKNLSLAPLAVGMSVVAMIVIEILSPMRLDHFVAMLAEIIPMYLVYCMVANTLSMLAPLPVASGSLKPVQPKGMAILLHLAFVFVFAFVMALTQIPLGLELLINWFGWGRPFPVFLVLALMECAGVVYLYRFVLRLQGEFLQSREQKILEIVTSKIE